MPPLLLVVNANASDAPRGARLDRLVRMLRDGGAAVDVQVTSSRADLARVWAHDDGGRLVLVGGDGSVHAVANLDGPSRDVALIPAGRANNVARSLGIPAEPSRAAALAARGEVRPIDLMEARTSDRRYIVVESVSAGFLAAARVRYRGRNSADGLAGLKAGVAALAAFHPFAARIAGITEDELTLGQVFVANLPLYEFGLRVAPHAVATDALLDVVGIEARSRREVIAMIARLRRGTQLHRPGTHLYRATRVTLSTDGSSPIVADSEDLGAGPVSLTPMPLALRIVRP